MSCLTSLMPKLICTIIILLGPAGLMMADVPTSAPPSSPKVGEFDLRVDGGRVFLTANEAEAKAILQAIAAKAGVSFDCQGDVRDKRTLVLDGLPVEDAVKRVAGNYVLQFVRDGSQGTTRLIGIRIAPSAPSAQGEAPVAENRGATATVGARPVPQAAARRVGEHYLPKYYPDEWIYLTTFTFYGLDGTPAVYAAIFHRPTCKIGSQAELEDHIAKRSAARRALSAGVGDAQKGSSTTRSRQELAAAERDLYLVDDVATVFVGTNTEQNPLLGCHKGLPAGVAEQADIRARLAAEGRGSVGRTIWINRFDVRVETAANASALAAADSGKPLDDNASLLSVAKREFSKAGPVRAQIEQALQRQANELKLMEPARRAKIEEATENTRKATREQWKEFGQ